MTWITTNTIAGPLTSDNYYFTITGLSASTKYQYRAYFIVDGVEYYGNVLTGTTAPITLYVPTVITGDVSGLITSSGFTVANNNINCNGNSPIIEYGLLYTQQSIYGTNSTLVYNNYPAIVCKISTLSDIPSIPYIYSANTTGLMSNTLTYYRAFAKNAKGIGYGTIHTQQTEPPLASNILFNVDVFWNCLNPSVDDGFGGQVLLMCCSGSLVESYDIPEYQKSASVTWIAPAGCYYVDFIQLHAKYNGEPILMEFMWSDGNNIGYELSTCCYNTNKSISAYVPNMDLDISPREY